MEQNLMDTQNTPPLPRRLYKSRQNRMLDGVCGGVAEYFDVDPTIVRIVWALVTLAWGLGAVLYIIAMIVMPVNPAYRAGMGSPAPGGTPAPGGPAVAPPPRHHYVGIVLILIGCFLMIFRLGWMFDFGLWDISEKVVFPFSLIALGLILVYTHFRRQEAEAAQQGGTSSARPPARQLTKSLTDKKFCGVCGGIAAYLNIDPTIVRIIFAGFVVASFGLVMLLYLALCILMPVEKPVPVNPS
jgi:phage shock protein C